MMRCIQILVLVVISLLGCSKNDENDIITNDSIIGQWQLIEQWLGDISSDSVEWGEVVNGYTMTFLNDGLYSSNEFTVCQNNLNSGSYSLSGSESIRLVETSFLCESSNDFLTRVYIYNFEGEFLMISPHSNPCPEGCSFKFKRINTE